MTLYMRVGIVCLAWMAILFIGNLAKDRSIVSFPNFVSEAAAVVGRPLTPVSVAGAARRTTRRCAAGVYNC